MEKDKGNSDNVPTDKLCTACGKREKKKGNRFLCTACEREETSDVLEEHYVGHL